jgi:sulfopyruvate decarboxylase subunit alpha
MASGSEIVGVLQRCGVTHVVWIPDSEIGPWDAALSAARSPKLIRPTREGEAIAIAGGLWLGGARPLVMIQCTGLFEAGDALRNIIHDLKVPLPLLIGLRGYHAHREGRSSDTCPVFTEPILQAWRLPYTLLERGYTVERLEQSLRQILDSGKAGAVVLAE